MFAVGTTSLIESGINKPQYIVASQNFGKVWIKSYNQYPQQPSEFVQISIFTIKRLIAIYKKSLWHRTTRYL